MSKSKINILLRMKDGERLERLRSHVRQFRDLSQDSNVMFEHSANEKRSRSRVLPFFFHDLTSAIQILPPAAVLPEQLHSARAHPSLAEGTVALMRAVLVDAIDCFQNQERKNTVRARTLGQEAERWIFSDEDSWPFSFVNICAVLGLDVGYVRRGLQSWRGSPAVQLTTKRVRKNGVRPLSSLAR